MIELSKAGREELALALILLKDFKCDGKLDIEVSKRIFEMAKYLGVASEFNFLTSRVPPLKIVPR